MAKKGRRKLTVNNELLNKYIRHSINIEQLKNSEARKIGSFLKKETFPQIYKKLITELSKIKNIESLGSIYRIKRLKQLLASVQKISSIGIAKAEGRLVSNLENISLYEANWNSKTIQDVVPLDIDFTMPSNSVLKQLVVTKPMEGHKLSSWIKSYPKAVTARVNKQLRTGIAAGESLPAIGQRIRSSLKVNTKQAEYIARTAVSNVVHNAREATFKENKDLIRGVQWIATLDDRTTLVCINLDGKIFEVGEGERPPAHFNCRSTTVPVVNSWSEYGIEDPPPATRASMDGAVPEKTNYRKWLKTQPKAIQDKVLGKTKAELFRSGRVSISKFVGKDLKPLTLKQISKREGIKLEEAAVSLSEVNEVKILINSYKTYINNKNFIGAKSVVRKLASKGVELDKTGNIISSKVPNLNVFSNEDLELIKKYNFYRRRFDEPNLRPLQAGEIKKQRDLYLSKLEKRGITRKEAITGTPKEVDNLINKVEKNSTSKEALDIDKDINFKKRFSEFKVELQKKMGVDFDNISTKVGNKDYEEAFLKFKKAILPEVKPTLELTKYKDSIIYNITKGDIIKQTKSAMKQVESLLDKISSLSSDSFLNKLNNSRFGGINIGPTKSGGAYVRMNTLFSPDTTRRRLWHEMGHIIENANYEIREKLKQWMIERSGGKRVSLAYLGKTGYAYKGKFIDNYVGRIYPTGHTEVISMAFEQFVSDRQMFLFAKKDFDHFALILGILRNVF
jgi:SPP1 gp7 family putative phage head morphogenesis protein